MDNASNIILKLHEKANSLPLCPGVYIMKDAGGGVIYVGKSKKLKNRVTSYFTGTNHTPKTERMVSLVRDFDYIVCDTEIEALTLENVLIKKHSPKYNIKLKDAKSYPYIKVSAEPFPHITVTRERKSDYGRYYGPYRGTSDAYGARDTIMRVLALPTCRLTFPRDIGKSRPCLYRDMGRCIAPCTGNITGEEYRARIKQAETVLDGNIKDAVAGMRQEMEEAAENLEFERAARLRDSISALEKLAERQKVVADERVSRDVFALYNSGTEGVLAMLSVRGGALINKSEFILSAEELTSPEDALPLIADYYESSGSLPREIMLDFELTDEDTELLSEYLSLGAPHKVRVRVPKRGDSRALCDMALENAKEQARQSRLADERENKSVTRLSELLGLPKIPRRIEAYDISNLGNENITASMVVCEGGHAKKSDYRIFRIKSTETADDYQSMRETLSRRLSHIGDGSPSLGECPDLILLDGGEGQVSVVREVMAEMNINIPLFGMVKDDYHKTRALTDGEREISIAQERSVYTFVYTLQEEVHRFAITSMSKAKRTTLSRSSLEKIPGIGAKKAKLLLHAMPLKEIKVAAPERLAEIPGISETNAREIYSHFHGGENAPARENEKEENK